MPAELKYVDANNVGKQIARMILSGPSLATSPDKGVLVLFTH